MIKAVLFDLGGTLHKSSSPPGRDLWFAQRLIERFSDCVWPLTARSISMNLK